MDFETFITFYTCLLLGLCSFSKVFLDAKIAQAKSTQYTRTLTESASEIFGRKHG